MAATPITPPNAAPFDNTAPQVGSPPNAAAFSNTGPAVGPTPQRFYCAARFVANLSSLYQVQGAGYGIDLSGPLSTVKQRGVLLTEQTAPAENGVYYFTSQGASVNVSGNFSAGGTFQKTGLIPNAMYYWSKGNGTSITNGTTTITATGFIAADGSGNVTINGPANASITDGMTNAGLTRMPEYDQPNELPVDLVVTARNFNVSAQWSTWRLTALVPTVGTSPMTFEQVVIAGVAADAWGFPAFDNTAPGVTTPARAAAFSNTAPEVKTLP